MKEAQAYMRVWIHRTYACQLGVGIVHEEGRRLKLVIECHVQLHQAHGEIVDRIMRRQKCSDRHALAGRRLRGDECLISTCSTMQNNVIKLNSTSVVCFSDRLRDIKQNI